MTVLLLLVLVAGLMPLGIAILLMPPARRPLPSAATLAGSSLLCTLAFNLTFFWQELWLVLAKAMTPGVHPILYHNDHDWTGSSPFVELLQGAGALATFGSGLLFLLILAQRRAGSGTGRLFAAWMAFEGLFQSLSQVAIGALLPGNDVGRAFTFLGLQGAARLVALAGAVVAMAGAGALLARRWPSGAARQERRPDRGTIAALAVPAGIAVALLIPFRLPRDLIEVILVPATVHILGTGWVALGMVRTRRPLPFTPPGIMIPAAALIAVLLLFRLVLARGIAF